MEPQTEEPENQPAAADTNSRFPLLLGAALVAASLLVGVVLWFNRDADDTSDNESVTDDGNGDESADDPGANLAEIGLSADGRVFTAVEDTTLSNATLADLAAIDTVREVSIEGCSSVTRDGLAHLGKLTSLQRLNLRRVSLQDGELEFLAGMEELLVLDLGFNEELSDAAMLHLGKLGRLETLSLDGCSRLTDKGLMALKGLTSLREVDLSWCSRPTGPGIRVLLDALPNLQVLRLAHTQHGDELLKALGEVEGLKTLELTSTPNLTDEALRDFESRHPGLSIVR